LERSPSASLIQYASFNDSFAARIIFPQRINLSSFYVPSRVTFRINRLTEQKFDTRTDSLNIGSALGFSSINMFGVMGFYPIFKFYHSDEYSHTIDTAFVIPREEDISWRIQSTLNAGFRGFSDGTLNFINTFTIRSAAVAGTNSALNNLLWTESFVASWEVPTKNSLLSVFYDWLTSKTSNQFSVFGRNYQQFRSESLELTVDKSTDHLRWSVTAGHEEIVRILGRLNLTSFIKLKMSENKFYNIFTFDVLIGTTLRVSF
jgi:hypothetical protein